jgi:hypothetical protein
MVGYFACRVYLRVQLSVDETFTKLITKVRNELYEALVHQDFGKAVADNPALGASNLFQWFPWKLDEVVGLPPPALSRELNISSEPIFSEAQYLLPHDIVVTVLANIEDRIHGTVFYREGEFSGHSLEQFAQGIRLTSELLLLNPDSSLETIGLSP